MIGIINYGAGNIFSLTSALDRLNIQYGMVNAVSELDLYSHIIIPGVGHAGRAMDKLKQTGMVKALKSLKKPVLGICVGMQLLTAHSEEGDATLMDVVPLRTRLFNSDLNVKVPHMGWNNIINEENALFKGIKPGSHFYFVHSYFIEHDAAFTIATATYGQNFSAAIQYSNFYGVQFHPEKSGDAGEQILVNFTKI